MSNRRALWGSLVLTAGCCLALLVPAWRDPLLAALWGQPLYRGRLVEHWCRAPEGGDPAVRGEAAAVLLEALRDGDPQRTARWRAKGRSGSGSPIRRASAGAAWPSVPGASPSAGAGPRA